MGENSKIEWTKHTWNPWVGCFKVSSGCKNCYMYRDQNRYGNDPKEIRKTKHRTFYRPMVWGLNDPGLVFTCSWSDFFLKEVSKEWRDEAWKIIKMTPYNTYQILTKRPENILNMLPDDWADGWDNVWLGVSVENQDVADIRIPELLKIPARVRFLSVEPLLGPVELGLHGTTERWTPVYEDIDWVIVGGESGPNRRPMDLEWARDIRDQCEFAGIAFFFKQIDKVLAIPEDLMIREFPS